MEGSLFEPSVEFSVESSSLAARMGRDLTGNCVAAGCTTGFAHGIVFDGTSGFRIQGVRAGQAVGQGNKQGYGIFLNTGCNIYIVTGNDTRINVSGGINNVPGISATRIVKDNL